MMDRDPKMLYEEHEEFAGTSKGLMMHDEWRYSGRVGVASGIVSTMRPSSVLDVGCGYGDLSPFCFAYHGIDYTSWVIDEARRRYPLARFECTEVNSLVEMGKDPFGMVAALGILATTEKSLAEEFIAHLVMMSLSSVMLSYLDPEHYDGRLISYSLLEIETLFIPLGMKLIYGPVWSPNDEMNKTVVFI